MDLQAFKLAIQQRTGTQKRHNGAKHGHFLFPSDNGLKSGLAELQCRSEISPLDFPYRYSFILFFFLFRHL